MVRPTPFRIALAGLVAASVGCPGSLEDPGRFSDAATACPDVPQDIFGKVCSTPGCHSSVDKMLGLDLQSPDVASRLVGVPATGGPGLLIDPANPAMSIIYMKLTAMPPYGVRMPFNEPPLDDATIACVLEWITAEVADAGAEDASDATIEAAPEDALPGDDAASPPPATDAAVTEDAATVLDAGKAPDARAVVKDASTPPVPDASVRDAAPPVDAPGD
jgi:hypothetical protein